MGLSKQWHISERRQEGLPMLLRALATELKGSCQHRTAHENEAHLGRQEAWVLVCTPCKFSDLRQAIPISGLGCLKREKDDSSSLSDLHINIHRVLGESEHQQVIGESPTSPYSLPRDPKTQRLLQEMRWSLSSFSEIQPPTHPLPCPLI